MTPTRRWIAHRLIAIRDRGARGATLVEYALISSFFVVVSMVAIDFLTDAADDEISNQADCVSMRPPPAECQLAPLPPEAPPTIPVNVPFPVLPPDAPEPFVDDQGNLENTNVGGTWRYFRDIYVAADDLTEMIPVEMPIQNAHIRFRVRMLHPVTNQVIPPELILNCWTNEDGRCEDPETGNEGVGLEVPFGDVNNITVTILEINLPPGYPPVGLPSPNHFTPSRP